jgi:hypothetical protein
MAKHEVKFSIPERELGKADLEFKVKRNGTTLGTLKISRGSVVWVPKDAQYGYKMDWADFHRIMAKQGEREGSK